MRSVARRSVPTRWNWTWLISGVLAALVLGAAVLHYPGGSCRRAGGEGLPPPGLAAAAGLPAAGTAVGAGTRDGGAARRPRLPASPGQPTATTRPAGAGVVARATALYYDPGSAVGSCTLGPFPGTGLYASLPPHRYGKGTLCGSYLEIRGHRGTVRAEVVDLCPGCAPDTINLSRAAFGKIVGTGSAQVTYRPLVNPALPGPIALRVGATDNGRTTVQVINNGNPLRSVSIAPAPAGASPSASPGSSGTPAVTWQDLRPNTNDFWVATRKVAAGAFTVRVTDHRGHQAVLPHVTLRPGALIHTGVWMYRVGASPSPSAASHGSTAPPSASPTGGGGGTPATRRAAAARGNGC
jgi:expansin (peptidoglycan-binding protein)